MGVDQVMNERNRRFLNKDERSDARFQMHTTIINKVSLRKPQTEESEIFRYGKHNTNLKHQRKQIGKDNQSISLNKVDAINLINQLDSKVLSSIEAALDKMLYFFSRDDTESMQNLVDSDVIAKVVMVLKSCRNEELQERCISLLTNVALFKNSSSSIIYSDVVNFLKQILLNSSSNSLREQTMWLLSNLVLDEIDVTEAVISCGLIETSLSILNSFSLSFFHISLFQLIQPVFDLSNPEKKKMMAVLSIIPPPVTGAPLTKQESSVINLSSSSSSSSSSYSSSSSSTSSSSSISSSSSSILNPFNTSFTSHSSSANISSSNQSLSSLQAFHPSSLQNSLFSNNNSNNNSQLFTSLNPQSSLPFSQISDGACCSAGVKQTLLDFLSLPSLSYSQPVTQSLTLNTIYFLYLLGLGREQKSFLDFAFPLILLLIFTQRNKYDRKAQMKLLENAYSSSTSSSHSSSSSSSSSSTPIATTASESSHSSFSSSTSSTSSFSFFSTLSLPSSLSLSSGELGDCLRFIGLTTQDDPLSCSALEDVHWMSLLSSIASSEEMSVSVNSLAIIHAMLSQGGIETGKVCVEGEGITLLLSFLHTKRPELRICALDALGMLVSLSDREGKKREEEGKKRLESIEISSTSSSKENSSSSSSSLSSSPPSHSIAESLAYSDIVGCIISSLKEETNQRVAQASLELLLRLSQHSSLLFFPLLIASHAVGVSVDVVSDEASHMLYEQKGESLILTLLMFIEQMLKYGQVMARKKLEMMEKEDNDGKSININTSSSSTSSSSINTEISDIYEDRGESYSNKEEILTNIKKKQDREIKIIEFNDALDEFSRMDRMEFIEMLTEHPDESIQQHACIIVDHYLSPYRTLIGENDEDESEEDEMEEEIDETELARIENDILRKNDMENKEFF